MYKILSGSKKLFSAVCWPLRSSVVPRSFFCSVLPFEVLSGSSQFLLQLAALWCPQWFPTASSIVCCPPTIPGCAVDWRENTVCRMCCGDWCASPLSQWADAATPVPRAVRHQGHVRAKQDSSNHKNESAWLTVHVTHHLVIEEDGRWGEAETGTRQISWQQAKRAKL